MTDTVDVTHAELELLVQASQELAEEWLPMLLYPGEDSTALQTRHEASQGMGERIAALGQACGFVGLRWLGQRLQGIADRLMQANSSEPQWQESLMPLLLTLPQALESYFKAPQQQTMDELTEQNLRPLEALLGLSANTRSEDIQAEVVSRVQKRQPADIAQMQLHSADVAAPQWLLNDPQLLELLEQELPALAQRMVEHAQALEHAEDVQTREALRRVAHTIKGSANTAGLRAIAVLAHLLEEWLLEHPESTEVSLPPWCEAMRDAVQAAMRGVPLPASARNAYQALFLAVTGTDAPPLPEAPAPTTDVYPLRHSAVIPNAAGAAAGQLLERQAALAQHLATTQAELTNLIALRAASRTAAERLAILGSELQALADRQRLITDLPSAATTLQTQQAELDQLARRLDELVQDERQTLVRFDEHLWSLREATESLQSEQQLAYDALWSAQAVTVESLSPRLERMVRQVGLATGKQVALRLDAGAVKLPRADVEPLLEVLGHLLRNAVDHGIESPEIRQAKGKAALGYVRLQANANNAGIRLEVSDDGAGLDLSAIEARGRKLGWLDAAGATPPPEELAQWVFEAGFSTQASSNLWSGRGIGLDVVRSMVQAHAGRVELLLPNRFVIHWPAPGQQIAVLTVPLAGGQIALYAPQLQEVLDACPPEEPRGPEAKVIDIAGRIRFPNADADISTTSAGLANHADGLLLRLEGLPWVRVPDLGSALRVPLYPLPGWVIQGPGLMGACVLGDGQTLMVLNLAAWLSAGAPALAGAGSGEEEVAGRVKDPRPTVLVVDDAVVVRQQTALYMQDCGWRVLQARDGLDALRYIEQGVPDLILTDLEMPRCNGIELASRLRRQPSTSAIPMILITSRSGAWLNEQAVAAGIDAVLTKPFDEVALQQAIRRLAPLPSQAAIG